VLGPSGQAPPLRLVDDAGRENPQLAVVLVPSNPYALDRPPPRGTRPALDTGQLGIVVLDVPGDSAPFPGARPGPRRTWRSVPSARCPAGIDGEAVPLSPPLRFVIRPARLRVRISARHPGTSPAARFPLSRP
jgi:hypothetical protein